jgi:hypothetical protein
VYRDGARYGSRVAHRRRPGPECPEQLRQAFFAPCYRVAVATTSGDELRRVRAEPAAGDRRAAADLLPLVYDELRKLAARRLERFLAPALLGKPGQGPAARPAADGGRQFGQHAGSTHRPCLC